jgi:hypothetical protein
MRKFTSTICAAAMALAIPFATAPAASAMPTAAPAYNPAAVPLIQVQGDGRWGRDNPRPRNYNRWRPRQYGYYRGHRGYRHQRPGYRYHNGFWFPAAAFITGAIVGGAIAQQPQTRYVPRASGGNAHIQWCYDRYRSYRDYDNTFQPYNGPRRQCRSPYG